MRELQGKVAVVVLLSAVGMAVGLACSDETAFTVKAAASATTGTALQIEGEVEEGPSGPPGFTLYWLRDQTDRALVVTTGDAPIAGERITVYGSVFSLTELTGLAAPFALHGALGEVLSKLASGVGYADWPYSTVLLEASRTTSKTTLDGLWWMTNTAADGRAAVTGLAFYQLGDTISARGEGWTLDGQTVGRQVTATVSQDDGQFIRFEWNLSGDGNRLVGTWDEVLGPETGTSVATRAWY
jgi:hypothetical protein